MPQSEASRRRWAAVAAYRQATGNQPRVRTLPESAVAKRRRASGAWPKELANSPENECLHRLWARGYDATKRGWPDFAVFRPDGSLVVVEVKPGATSPLKHTQARIIGALLRAGIECYRFDPVTGFARLRVCADGAVEVDGLTDKSAAGLRVVNPAALVAPPAGDASAGAEVSIPSGGIRTSTAARCQGASGAPGAAVGAQ